MDWKELLKPTIAKVIIAITLFLVFIALLAILPSKVCSQMDPSYCFSILKSILNPFYVISDPLLRRISQPALFFVALGIISYVVSTAIVYTFHKLKK